MYKRCTCTGTSSLLMCSGNSINLASCRLGDAAVVGMERLPAWDPFYPRPGDLGQRNPSEAPCVSLFLCLAGEQAVICRIEGEHVGPRVSLVPRHGTSPFTCGTPARALATIFLGAASGNILAFPARVQAANMGGSQVM